jgi:hypothetical protein
MANPTVYGADLIDLSKRFGYTSTVAASPAASTITTIATLNIQALLGVSGVNSAVWLEGFAAYTVGTNGVSVLLEIRQTNTVGTSKGSTGATTAVAANLGALSVNAIDLAPPTGGVYVLCMTVASGSASTTVSQCFLSAVIV